VDGLERVAVAVSIITLILLTTLGGISASAKGYYRAWAKVENGFLYLKSPFIDARINLTAGASITYLSLLGDTIYNCSASKDLLPGFHVSTFTPQNFRNGSISSLALGPWNAEVVKNNSDVVIVKLTPSPATLQDVEPLDVEVYITVAAYEPVIRYRIIFRNPADTNVTLKALVLSGKQLSIDLILNTCPTTARMWSFIAVYGNTTRYSIYHFQGSNETAYSKLLPSNSTLLGAALVESVHGAVNRILFVRGDFDYYMARLPLAGPLSLHAYKEGITIKPGGQFSLDAEVGILPFNAVLLDRIGMSGFAYVLDKNKYMRESLDEASYYKIVHKLNATIARLNESLNSYKTSLDKCQTDRSNLQHKLGELKELLDTCQVNLNITKNHLSSEVKKVKSAAFKIVVFAVLGIIIGAAGGYFAALTRVQQAPTALRGARKK
jgi:exonuclease VII small subunit